MSREYGSPEGFDGEDLELQTLGVVESNKSSDRTSETNYGSGNTSEKTDGAIIDRPQEGDPEHSDFETF